MPVSILNFNPDPAYMDTPMVRLDATKLDKERVYFIYAEADADPLNVINYLKYVTFRNHERMYSSERTMVGPIPIHAFSVPKEYKDTCKKIAEHYGLIMKHESTAVVDKDEIGVVIPKSDQIVLIRSKDKILRAPAIEKMKAEQEEARLKKFGASLDESKLD